MKNKFFEVQNKQPVDFRINKQPLCWWKKHLFLFRLLFSVSVVCCFFYLLTCCLSFQQNQLNRFRLLYYELCVPLQVWSYCDFGNFALIAKNSNVIHESCAIMLLHSGAVWWDPFHSSQLDCVLEVYAKHVRPADRLPVQPGLHGQPWPAHQRADLSACWRRSHQHAVAAQLHLVRCGADAENCF